MAIDGFGHWLDGAPVLDLVTAETPVASVIAPAFGSYVYEDNSADIESWNDELPRRTPVVEVARGVLARSADGYLSPRQVSIQGKIGLDGGSDRVTLRGLVDAFQWAHRPGQRSLYRDTDRYLRLAQVQSLTVGDDTGLSFVPYQIRFVCPDPYFYTTDAADTDLWTGSPASGSTHGITNGGAATAAPTFVISVGATATGTTITLTNQTTGESFVLADDVTSGDFYTVNCLEQTVSKNGANRMSAFVGAFFLLDPGVNTLKVEYTGTTVASVASSWLRRWL